MFLFLCAHSYLIIQLLLESHCKNTIQTKGKPLQSAILLFHILNSLIGSFSCAKCDYSSSGNYRVFEGMICHTHTYNYKQYKGIHPFSQDIFEGKVYFANLNGDLLFFFGIVFGILILTKDFQEKEMLFLSKF